MITKFKIFENKNFGEKLIIEYPYKFDKIQKPIFIFTYENKIIFDVLKKGGIYEFDIDVVNINKPTYTYLITQNNDGDKDYVGYLSRINREKYENDSIKYSVDDFYNKYENDIISFYEKNIEYSKVNKMLFFVDYLSDMPYFKKLIKTKEFNL